MPIKISVDVTKLDKTKFIHGKNGAIYCDLVLWESPDDKFGNDWSVKQDSSREERASGVRMPFVGNGKNFGSAASPRGESESRAGEEPARQKIDEDDDIPF